jgi:nucleoside phosphorylase
MPRDDNTYTFGIIGNYYVVLLWLPRMGKTEAAAGATSLKINSLDSSFALVVGICGGVPEAGEGEETLLGDVIISKGIKKTDYGRQLASKFVPRHKLFEPHQKLLGVRIGKVCGQ